jgi:hypothetical protein
MRTISGVAAFVTFAAAMTCAASAAPGGIAADRLPIASGQLTPVEAKVAPDLRVRLAVLTTSASVDSLVRPDGPVQHRFASSMIDYYPFHGSGLHLSGGMKFFSVANFVRDAEKATGGLLYMPRLPGAGSGIRTGFNRRTPAATVGYSKHYDTAMFGVEVGTLVGAANADLPRSYRLLGEHRGGINPIANLVVGMKF